jgi:predicted PurR-regulated permease PerM
MPSPVNSIERSPERARERRQYSAVRSHILFFFVVLLGLMLAWRLRAVLELVYVSALFAVVLMPAVQWVMRIKIGKWQPSRLIAIVSLVISVFVLLGLFFTLALPPVLRDMQHFATDLPAHVTQLLGRLTRLPIAAKFGVNSLAEKSEGLAGMAAKYLIASAPLWLSHILDLLTALILCIYFMLEGEFAYAFLISMFPSESRERLAKTLAVADQRMSKWLLGQGSLMLILGVTSTIAFGLLHVRYFFMLGVLMGLFNIIPIVGGAVTILLAAAVAALDSWTKMAGVFIFYAIYVQVENAYLTPRIMRSSVNLTGLAVVIALLAGWDLAGVVGALVAVPTAALISVLMQEYLVQTDVQEAVLLQQYVVQKEVAVEEAKEAAADVAAKEDVSKEAVVPGEKEAAEADVAAAELEVADAHAATKAATAAKKTPSGAPPGA